LRVFHRANRALLFAVFANFAFTFYTLFASLPFAPTVFIAGFLLLNFFWEETMLSVRAKVSLQNLHACVHAHNKTEHF